VSLGSALHLAGAVGKMQALDFHFDLTQKYTLWSGLIGGLFLSLSYFGCDQSQVQRYLTAKSVEGGRRSLFVSAYAKIPLQALILLTGVLMFAFFLFHKAPMLFNAAPVDRLKAGPRAAEYHALEQEYDRAYETRRQAAESMAGAGGESTVSAERQAFVAADTEVRAVRDRAKALVKDATKADYDDVNYVFPTFVTTYMPVGLVGLVIAAIFAAAMSASAGELNSLATATVIDIYKRHVRPVADDSHYLLVSKIATAAWGLFACVGAMYAVQLGSLIEVVNTFGSYFYGSILGVFILAIGLKRANGHGAFVGLIGGMIVVWAAVTYTKVAFLWLNVLGAVVVTVIGLVVSAATGGSKAEART
jgi:Na+/proline symporter